MELLKLLAMLVILALLSRQLFNRMKDRYLYPAIRTQTHHRIDHAIEERILSHRFGMEIEVSPFEVETVDGEMLHGVIIRNHDSPRCLLFSHGNGSQVATQYEFVSSLAGLGSVVWYDYRGYGESSGAPNEYGLLADIAAVWKYLLDHQRFMADQITLFGHSLGAAVSVWLASVLVDPPASLIMAAGFNRLVRQIGDLYGPVVARLSDDEFPSEEYLRRIGDRFPVLVLHNEDDEYISYDHHRRLLEANPSAIHRPIRGTHGFIETDHELLETLRRFLDGESLAESNVHRSEDSVSIDRRLEV